MAGFFGDFMGSLGQGFQNAGAILSPTANAQQEQERQQAMQQRSVLAQHIMAGIQNGSIPPDQGQAVLQKLGVQIPGMGPTPEAQQAQLNLNLDKQAFPQGQPQAAPPPTPGMVPSGMTAPTDQSPPQIAPQAGPDPRLASPRFRAMATAQSQIDARKDVAADRKVREKEAEARLAQTKGYQDEIIDLRKRQLDTTNNPSLSDPVVLQFWVDKWEKDKTLPPIAWGIAGNPDRKIFSEAVAKHEASQGKSGAEVARGQAEFHANAATLTNITKDITTFEPYKNMLDKNGNIAIQLGEKITNTDASLANRPLNWLKQHATTNPDVAEYMFQINTLQTEAARVLNNPRLVGQMSYEATKDMHEVMNGDMPIPSANRVIRRMQQDGSNRLDAMKKQKQGLSGDLSGSPSAPASTEGWSIRPVK